MLALSMEPEGSSPSSEGPRHLNGPAIALKIAGANTTNGFWPIII